MIRIAEEDMHGMKRAEYGKQVVKKLSEYLTEKYGEGFSTTNLWHFVDFCKCYPSLFDLDDNILQILHLSSGELENIFHPIVEMRQKSATQRSSFDDKEG